MDKATQNLLDGLKAYTDGLIPAMNAVKQTGVLDQISASVASTISKSVPGASQAIAIGNGVLGAIATATGPYSTLSRVAKDAMSGLVVTAPIRIIKDLSGRTLQSDQYWAGVFYRYLVLGDSKSINTNYVSDGDAMNALTWFINKTGVFISGREHIEALQAGVQQYINLHSVNAYTTTDVTRVGNAVNVMKSYMPDANINIIPAGSWANAVGVFDSLLAGLIVGSPAYNEALQEAKQTYVATDEVPIGLFGIGFTSDDILLAAAVIVVILIIVMLYK